MNINKLVKQGTYDRNYRTCTTNYSLNPAIAYALNQLAGLDEEDKILDPCCGTGTVLIERQLLKSCLCIGVDISQKALDCAQQNIKAAKIEVELKHGNITGKKFPNNYFTKIISNLPYGIHSGSRQENIILYRFLADESIKWLKKGGKAIFITNAKTLLRNSFAFNPNWTLTFEESLSVGGLNLSVFIFQKEF